MVMSIIKKRFSEPSTYAGLAGILLGLGQLFKINEAASLADVVTQTGTIAATGNVSVAIGVAVAGVLAVFLPEKK